MKVQITFISANSRLKIFLSSLTIMIISIVSIMIMTGIIYSTKPLKEKMTLFLFNKRELDNLDLDWLCRGIVFIFLLFVSMAILGLTLNLIGAN